MTETTKLVLSFIAFYLISGLLALGLFEMGTKRISTKLQNAVTATQGVMIDHASTFMSRKASTILFFTVMWLFWPAVFVGALTEKKGDTDGKKG